MGNEIRTQVGSLPVCQSKQEMNRRCLVGKPALPSLGLGPNLNSTCQISAVDPKDKFPELLNGRSNEGLLLYQVKRMSCSICYHFSQTSADSSFEANQR
ncbi:unnamed protein product [Larinioides sclopetarius]|uniref:Uncharacterized protein n=1 Tax=Larinioides sclopetarius TaxID=280406 RepID=A0AAV1YQW4_9ARAC